MSENKYTEHDYVNILRRKLGEFMLTMIDLHQRGIKNSACVGEGDCIVSLIEALKDEGNAEGHIGYVFNKGNEHEQFYTNMTRRLYGGTLTKDDYGLLKQFVNLIITSNKYNSESEVRLLNVLLFNNGFPCTFLIKQKSQEEGIRYTEFDSLYKMYFILGDNSGKISSDTKNHYTIEIPDEFNRLLIEQKGYTIADNKIQISPDGNCFYTAVAVWCKIYGIKEDHLNSLTYNVPFDFSEEHVQKNLKVPIQTNANTIPEPIEFPKDNAENVENDINKFKTDALTIANNMINKITQEDFKPTFGEDLKEIKESQEYKDYDGLNKDNGTHCNKYKGNKDQETKVVEGPGN